LLAGRLVAMQMSHSSVSVNDRAIHPVPGKGPEMVDNHIASHIRLDGKWRFMPPMRQRLARTITSFGAGRKP
jgi:hypothetical protein